MAPYNTSGFEQCEYSYEEVVLDRPERVQPDFSPAIAWARVLAYAWRSLSGPHGAATGIS